MWRTLLAFIFILPCIISQKDLQEAEYKQTINKLFDELMEEGIRQRSTKPGELLSFVLSNLRAIDWVQLVREVDVIFDDSQKKKLEREIQYDFLNNN
jgi:hypothetical protein